MLRKFQELLCAVRDRAEGETPSDVVLKAILSLATILTYDFGGPDRAVAVLTLRGCVIRPEIAEAAFDTLGDECLRRVLLGRSPVILYEKRIQEALQAIEEVMSKIKKYCWCLDTNFRLIQSEHAA